MLLHNAASSNLLEGRNGLHDSIDTDGDVNVKRQHLTLPLCSLTAILGTTASVWAQGGHGAHSFLPPRGYVVRDRLESDRAPRSGEIPVAAEDPTGPVDLNRIPEMPDVAGALELLRLLPRAARA